MSGQARLEASLTRGLDVLISGLFLAVTAPLLAVTALAVRLRLGSPVLFRQERAGQGGAPFEMVKFRTMRHPQPGQEGPEHDGDRLTRLGRLLRATSLDELPTLVTVLRGRMSLVGPRPLPPRYLPRYSERHARRHDVRPGITGYAQSHGRNNLSWDEQLDLDVWYVEHRGLRLYLRVLARTAITVARREGVSQEGHDTRPEFTGSAETHVEATAPHPVEAGAA